MILLRDSYPPQCFVVFVFTHFNQIHESQEHCGGGKKSEFRSLGDIHLEVKTIKQFHSLIRINSAHDVARPDVIV